MALLRVALRGVNHCGRACEIASKCCRNSANDSFRVPVTALPGTPDLALELMQKKSSGGGKWGYIG